jgi:23S rRNA (cytidine2498-2'-O)-methyltransferase
VTTAYLAPEGFETELRDELALAGVRHRHPHGRLVIVDDDAGLGRWEPAWAANCWFDAESIPVTSIGDTARALRARQRNWASYAPGPRGRTALVEAKLPHVSAKPLALGDPAPSAPLGSWTFLSHDLVLAAPDCSSPFPGGEVTFVEDRDGPPSRAYRKLWEAFVRLGRRPGPGDRCLDLGASPGGWTWTMAKLGASVLAIDKAPLDPAVEAMPGVTTRVGSAFGIEPRDVEPMDWVCSDVIGYPERLFRLAERWCSSGRAANVVITIKLQGATDHAGVAAFAAIEGGRVVHLHHNKHELTFLWTRPGGTG